MKIMFWTGMMIVFVLGFGITVQYFRTKEAIELLSKKEACLQFGGTSVEQNGKFERCIP